MNRTILIALGLLVTGAVWFSCTQPVTPPEKVIAQQLSAQVDSFALLCKQLQAAADNPTKDSTASARLQRLFVAARRSYKRFEWAAEYFDPSAARAVNGPPVREVERSGVVFQPSGLQLIETLLFPSVDTTRRAELDRQIAILLNASERYKSHFANIEILEGQVFDAAKLEVFRIMTLGITGFDNPLTLQSSAESAAALESLQAVLANYQQSPTDQFAAATRYLSTHPDFNSLDRAAFITAYANPLTAAINDQQTALNIHVIRYNRLLNQDAKTLFDTAAFNVNAYSPDPASFISGPKIVLGQKLFTDPALSATGTRSCQSCHQPGKAFTDGLVRNTVLGGTDRLPRNTPTLINAALQPAQFYDMRVATLEDQSLMVVQNDAEMHGSMKLSVQRLWQDTAYRRLFSAAFPKKDRNGIDTLEVMNAIGSYVRSLVALDSRFDQYMRGNANALSANEVAGFNLFMGKARCGTCHYMPLFNGALPPRFVKVDAEIIGVPQTAAGKALDADPGRYAIVPDSSYRHAFKTPTVRNAARTAPYMHNGVFATLEEVVDFYDKGGGAGLGLKVDNQTLPFDKLHLTAQESRDLVAFIKSLDSR
jgi:cytochrome c peroxidase